MVKHTPNRLNSNLMDFTTKIWTDLLEMTRSDLVLIADATVPRAGHGPESILGPHGKVRVATIDSDVKPHGSKEVVRLNQHILAVRTENN